MKNKSLYSLEEMKQFIIKQIGEGLTPSLLKGHKHTVTHVIFSPNGDRLISGSLADKDEEFNNVLLWDVKTHNIILKLIIEPEDILSISFSPDGKKILSTNRSGKNNLALWNAETGRLIHNFFDSDSSALSAKFSSDEKKIISIDLHRENSYVTVWNSQTGDELFNLAWQDPLDRIIPKICISPNGEKIILYYQFDGYAKASIWSTNTGKLLLELEDIESNATKLEFSPDGTKFAIGINKSFNNIIIWDTLSGKKIITLKDQPQEIYSLVFSPDGRYILSTSFASYSTLILWDAISGEKLFNLIAHCAFIESVMFTSDSRYILSCSMDEKDNIIVWDVRNGKKLFNFIGHTFIPYSMALSSDNKTVVVGGWRSKDALMIWHIPFDIFTIIQNDLNREQIELLYDHYSNVSKNLKSVTNNNDFDSRIYQTLPDSIKQIIAQEKNNCFFSMIQNYLIKIYNLLILNSFSVLLIRLKRQCKYLKIWTIKLARQIRKSKLVNFIWKQKKNYGFLKLTLSNNSYNYKDASSIEMCILNYLLTSDMSYDLSFWKEWVFDDSVEGVCGNLTSLEKEKNSIIITDMYSEEEVPTELEITFDQYLQLLDDWEEKVIKKKPKEVIIKYENDRFIIETQD